MEATVEVHHPICCGIDVHKAKLTACLRTVRSGSNVNKEIQSFDTTTKGLLELQTWLLEASCPVVAMESTGVYWKPVYHILRHAVEVIVGNARDIRNLPGKKTDTTDAQWIAELLAHGLIRPSFVPPPEICALRDLTRTRVKIVQMRTQSKNRVHKTLQDCNIKLSSVASETFGKSGRLMLDALIAGQRDPKVLAQMAKGVLRRKIPQLELALTGQFTDHHGLLIQLSLEQIDQFDEQIARIDAHLFEMCGPMLTEIRQLISIPGIDHRAARDILGEIGTDMTRFVSSGRLSSWASMCPGNNESAGKRRGGRTRKGNRWLRRTLCECAWATRKTDTHLGRCFRRLEKRIGGKKAAMAVGHKMLVIIYHLLSDGTFYEEERYELEQPREKERQRSRAVRLLESMGYEVTLEPLSSSLSALCSSSGSGVCAPDAPVLSAEPGPSG
jgi:transposase